MELIREEYMKRIRPFYDVDIIKVLTGPRRAGKSMLLKAIQREIASIGVSGSHIISINFEEIDYCFITEAKELRDEIKSRIQDNDKYYIFLDEVQHIEGYEKIVAAIRATYNCSLFITGSDARMLMGDMATLLTGRTVEFLVAPFSFSESVKYLQINGRECNPYEFINDYIKWGGFPLRFDFVGEEPTMRYLSSLYNNIVQRDISSVSKKLDRVAFWDISAYILANAGKEFSAKNIIDYYSKHTGKSVSLKTVYNYIELMQRAYLLSPCSKYVLVGKKIMERNEKFYALDTGFRTLNTNTLNYEDTFFLENIVYNELRIRGYSVYTGKTYKGEIDFVVVNNEKKCFIQVSYLMTNAETINREFGAYSNITDASPKYVMSLDRKDLSHNGIAHLNIIDFLLGKVDILLT